MYEFDDLQNALGEQALIYQTALYAMTFDCAAKRQLGEDVQGLEAAILQAQAVVGVLMGILESEAAPEYLELIKTRMNIELLKVDTHGANLRPPYPFLN